MTVRKVLTSVKVACVKPVKNKKVCYSGKTSSK